MKLNLTDFSFQRRKLIVIGGYGCYSYDSIVEHRDGYLYAIPFGSSKVMKIHMETIDELGEDMWNFCY